MLLYDTFRLGKWQLAEPGGIWVREISVKEYETFRPVEAGIRGNAPEEAHQGGSHA